MEIIPSDQNKVIPSDLITSNKYLRLKILIPSRQFYGKSTELYPKRYPELFIKIIDGVVRRQVTICASHKQTN